VAQRGSVLVKRAPWKLTLGLLLLMLPARAGSIDPGLLPAEQRENFDVFRVRCSKCHTLDKPFNVRLSPEQWKRYVAKMQRRAGSGISEQSGEKILAFLIYKEAAGVSPGNQPVPGVAADGGP
jgi:hypothetical protein